MVDKLVGDVMSGVLGGGEGERFDALKRKVYLFILPLISSAVIFTLLLARRLDAFSAFDRVVLPVLAVLLLVFTALAYTSKRALGLVENGVFGVLAAVFLGKFAYSVLYAPVGSELTQTYIWTPPIYVTAFLIYETRGALVRSGLVYAVTLGVGFVAVFVSQPGAELAFVGGSERLLEFYLANGITVTLLFTFATLRQRVSELQASLAKMERLAHQDALTGLPNRRQLETDLKSEFAKTDRAGRHAAPLSVVIFDADNFKRVNDSYGHDVGDYALRMIAALLSEELREGDRFGRWGGEEFLVVAPQTDLKSALNLAERLRYALAAHTFHTLGTLTASFGVASFRPGDTPETLIKRADDALYESKSGGKNRVEAVAVELAETVALPDLFCPFDAPTGAHAGALQESTLAWIESFRAYPKEKTRRWVEGVNPGWLAATLHHGAPLEAQRLVSDWYLWMFLHDDRCDESDAGKNPAGLTFVNARLLEVLRGAPPKGGDEPLAHMLWELRGRLLAHSVARGLGGERGGLEGGGENGSAHDDPHNPESEQEPWITRFTHTVGAYLDATVWEAANRARGGVPKLSHYVQTRLLTSGLPIDTLLLEVADGVCLPAHVRDHAALRHITLLSDNAICWANDIFSLRKELEQGDVHNLVLALKHAHKLTLQEATNRAAWMHDEEVRRFLEHETQLPSFDPHTDAAVARYLAALRARMGGNFRWSQGAARYAAPASVPAVSA